MVGAVVGAVVVDGAMVSERWDGRGHPLHPLIPRPPHTHNFSLPSPPHPPTNPPPPPQPTHAPHLKLELSSVTKDMGPMPMAPPVPPCATHNAQHADTRASGEQLGPCRAWRRAGRETAGGPVAGAECADRLHLRLQSPQYLNPSAAAHPVLVERRLGKGDVGADRLNRAPHRVRIVDAKVAVAEDDVGGAQHAHCMQRRQQHQQIGITDQKRLGGPRKAPLALPRGGDAPDCAPCRDTAPSTPLPTPPYTTHLPLRWRRCCP